MPPEDHPDARVVPRLFVGLIDDAAVFPPGNAPLPDAVTAHRRHRAAWYAPLVGPLLCPASRLGDLMALTTPEEALPIGLVGGPGCDLDELYRAHDDAIGNFTLRQIETPYRDAAGLRTLVDYADDWPFLDVYAEVPFSGPWRDALDTIAAARGDVKPIAPKFRTGGATAAMFPPPELLADVIVACQQRSLPYKLTAGLHHAVRHTDPATGFVHHGFGNVAVATAAAAGGADRDAVAELLALTDQTALAPRLSALRHQDRPLWIGLGSCSVAEPLADLTQLGLLAG